MAHDKTLGAKQPGLRGYRAQIEFDLQYADGMAGSRSANGAEKRAEKRALRLKIVRFQSRPISVVLRSS